MNHNARRAAASVKPWVAWLGRAGYAARGAVYLTIGVLAILTAVGKGGRLTDGRGALDELHRHPLGVALVVILAIGLAGYGVWRSVQAFLDPGSEASGRWRFVKRAGWFCGGLLHFAFAAYAVSLLRGTAQQGAATSEAKRGTATALAWGPLGPGLVGLAGAALLAAGAYELASAWRAKLDDQLDLSPLASGTRRHVVQLCRFGIAARGVVFGVAGAFLCTAALNSDPSRAKGFAESLQALREAPFGVPLLASVARGLIGYAVYQLAEARYRRLMGRSLTAPATP